MNFQKLPMGVCNSPDIFQKKYEIFVGLDTAHSYIDNVLIITRKYFKDDLN